MYDQVYIDFILSKQIPLMSEIFKNCNVDEFPQLSDLQVTLSKSVVDFPDIINRIAFPISIPLNVRVLSLLPLEIFNLTFSHEKIEPKMVFKLNMNKDEVEKMSEKHMYDPISEACKLSVNHIVSEILLEIAYNYKQDFMRFVDTPIDLTKSQTIVVGGGDKFYETGYQTTPIFQSPSYNIIQHQNTKFIVLNCVPFDNYFILGENKVTLNMYNLFLPKVWDITDNICIEIYSSHKILPKLDI